MKKIINILFFISILSLSRYGYAQPTDSIQPLTAGELAAYRAHWAKIRPELDANIERHRKGDATLSILDAAGKPIAGARVEVRQREHDFVFGCNILPLGQLGVLNADYEEKFVKLFNLATTTLCLSEYRPESGEYRFGPDAPTVWRRPVPDHVVDFARRHNLRLKGQPLLADSWFPKWAKNMTPDQARALQTEYFQEVSKRYGDDFDSFDLVNEALLVAWRNKQRGWNFPLYTENLDFVPWAFKTAAPIFAGKHARLDINEAMNASNVKSENEKNEKYFNLVKKVVGNESTDALGNIGFQHHIFKNEDMRRLLLLESFTPQTFITNYARFAELKRPLYVTEITIPSTYPDLAGGELLQSEVAANLYRLWFSIEPIEGIIWWNLCDGAAFENEGDVRGALLDEHMREKPAYQALYQLIKRKWNTQEHSTTDAAGKAAFRGFYGDYDVIVTPENGTPQTFTLALKKGAPGTHTIRLK